MIKKLVGIISVILVVYLLICLSFYFFQESFIFHPHALPQNYTFSYPETFEEVMLNTPDGEKINALHFKTENPKGVVLYFHGNAGNLADWGSVAQQFLPNNYDLFIMDYRGFGKSTGKVSKNNLVLDAQFCYSHLIEQGYKADEIVIYGRSIGTGVASTLARTTEHAKLILESPFNNMTALVNHYAPFLPIKLLLRYKFPTDENIAVLSTPVYIIYGKQDEIIPYQLAEQLKAANANINSYIFDSGGHNNLASQAKFFPVMREILR